MVVGANVCDLTEDLLWFVCGLYVRMLTAPLMQETLICLCRTIIMSFLKKMTILLYVL